MRDEQKAMNDLWEFSVSHRNEYSSKIVDLNKTIISISGVMLSIFSAFFTLANPEQQVSSFIIQAALSSFLLCILLGIVSLHGHAEIHQKMLEESGRQLKGRTPSQAIEAMRFSSVSQSKVYYWSDNLCPVVFLIGLTLLTWHTVASV